MEEDLRGFVPDGARPAGRRADPAVRDGRSELRPVHQLRDALPPSRDRAVLSPDDDLSGDRMRQPGRGRRRRGDRRGRASPRGARIHPRRRGPSPGLADRRRAPSRRRGRRRGGRRDPHARRGPTAGNGRAGRRRSRRAAGRDRLVAVLRTGSASSRRSAWRARSVRSPGSWWSAWKRSRLSPGGRCPGPFERRCRISPRWSCGRRGALPARPNGPKRTGRATRHASMSR